MSGEDDPPSHTVLQVLLVVLGALSVLLVLPFLQAVLAGGLLAYLVVPVCDRLSRRLGPTLGTLVAVVATVLVVLVPLLVLLVVAADQAVSLVQGTEVPDVAAIERIVEAQLGAAVDLSTLQEPLTDAIETGFRGLLGRLVG
ncbi:MAG TPA: AI-2E family transporter, partial [Halobacteriales archaeon]|nr:AI-2E family transporter [Halobacteriales archaeon]